VKGLISRVLNRPRVLIFSSLAFPIALCLGCDDTEILTADMPLHLEEHLDAATIIGSEVPADLAEPVTWHFDVPQRDWRPVTLIGGLLEPVRPARTDDALRLPLRAANRVPSEGFLGGGIYAGLPDWRLEDWAFVEIRARTSDPMGEIAIGFNYTEEDPSNPLAPFYSLSDLAPLVTDGTVQTYRITMDSPGMRNWEGPWTHLAVLFVSQPDQDAATLDILSVSVVPKANVYADAPVGVREIAVGNRYRRALYTHAPGRLEYQVRVPEGGRLDVGFGVLRDDVPVTFRVEVQPPGGAPTTVLEESYDDWRSWGQRAVDLTEYAGRAVTLTVEADAEEAGTLAFWGAPTVSGSTRVAEIPNVIFYIIDGAGAEYMSLYGYNRRTTPNIDRLAAEGAVFERAYSNSTATRQSTPSFMTSLQHSVLGGSKNGFNVVPDNVMTMAQHFHRAGYQTGVFTANPNAGKMSGLERSVDAFQEGWAEFSYHGFGHWRESSKYLHEAFWSWRETYPAEPYWVHFQTVDIHGDFPAIAPFGGLFVSAAEVQMQEDWLGRLREADLTGPYDFGTPAWQEAGVSWPAYYAFFQGYYDEAMAFNDHQLGRLVERLKMTGEWDNTLLIVASDHSIRSAMADMSRAVLDSLPPEWEFAMFGPGISRVPLLFVWPGHIEGGQRFSKPVVSMIDLLPTILDLVDLPLPEVMQGQSLAPLLLGEGNVEPRPVILDEFIMDGETGELRGNIEVVDGRWGASLAINGGGPRPAQSFGERGRPVPLLLYDLWNDPYCLHSVHEEHPDLVEKYTAFLQAQFEAHLALGQLFTPSEPVPLTPEQLEMLRALGYIR
jgi:arylsulfatase A-like enzyme